MGSKKEIRGAFIGGFNRKDVAEYLSALAKKYNTLRTECESLRAENASLLERCTCAEATASELASALSEKWTPEDASQLSETSRESISSSLETAQLISRISELEEKLSEYDEAKQYIGDIEISAQLRAEAIKKSAQAEAAAYVQQINALIANMQSELANIYHQTDTAAGLIDSAETDPSPTA